MRILIEEYQYKLTDETRQHDLKCILKELGRFENVEGKVSRNYVSYILEQDPITFGDIDIIQLLDDYKLSNKEYKKGEPIYMLGSDLKKYRK